MFTVPNTDALVTPGYGDVYVTSSRTSPLLVLSHINSDRLTWRQRPYSQSFFDLHIQNTQFATNNCSKHSSCCITSNWGCLAESRLEQPPNMRHVPLTEILLQPSRNTSHLLLICTSFEHEISASARPPGVPIHPPIKAPNLHH